MSAFDSSSLALLADKACAALKAWEHASCSLFDMNQYAPFPETMMDSRLAALASDASNSVQALLALNPSSSSLDVISSETLARFCFNTLGGSPLSDELCDALLDWLQLSEAASTPIAFLDLTATKEKMSDEVAGVPSPMLQALLEDKRRAAEAESSRSCVKSAPHIVPSLTESR